MKQGSEIIRARFRPELCPNHGVVLRLICRNLRVSCTPLIQSREAGKDAFKLLYASPCGPVAYFGAYGRPIIPDVNDLAFVGEVFFYPWISMTCSSPPATASCPRSIPGRSHVAGWKS